MFQAFGAYCFCCVAEGGRKGGYQTPKRSRSGHATPLVSVDEEKELDVEGDAPHVEQDSFPPPSHEKEVNSSPRSPRGGEETIELKSSGRGGAAEEIPALGVRRSRRDTPGGPNSYSSAERGLEQRRSRRDTPGGPHAFAGGRQAPGGPPDPQPPRPRETLAASVGYRSEAAAAPVPAKPPPQEKPPVPSLPLVATPEARGAEEKAAFAQKDMSALGEEPQKEPKYEEHHPAQERASIRVQAAFAQGPAKEEVTPKRPKTFSGDAKEMMRRRREAMDAGAIVHESSPVARKSEIWSPERPAAPPLPVALLFPNQGQERQGMLQRLEDLPAAAALVERANEVLGYDLVALCRGGEDKRLEQTRFCQPALYVAEACAAERLRQDSPDWAGRCTAVAGIGVGELVALHMAGVWSFDAGLRVARLRAEAMHEAAEACSQQQMMVMGLELDKVRPLCEQAQAACGDSDVCQVSSALIPKGVLCAGTPDAMSRLAALVRVSGSAKTHFIDTPQHLGVGAFQTELMRPAEAKFRKALEAELQSMRPPQCAVYFSAKATALPAGSDPKLLVDCLTEQLTSTVLWEQTVRKMLADGTEEFVELAPMQGSSNFKGLMPKISTGAFRKTSVTTPEGSGRTPPIASRSPR